MSTSFGAELVQSAKEALAIAEGRAAPARERKPLAVDVRAVRKRIGLTQEGFASRLRIPLATVRDWEQGRREPDAAARTLLRIVDKEPEAVLRALANG